ncbi:MAG: hypothetical protein ABI459_00215 [Deltaproteobacteria bacterium]
MIARRISEFIPPEVVVDTDAVSALYVRGSSSTLVVTFSGVGRDPQKPPEVEFLGTASGGGTNHVLAITDLKRTWYSQPEVLDDISRAFDATVARLKPTRIVAVGNSMGGYGAILFSAKFGFEITLAIAPQYSMKEAVVNEGRWSDYRQNFGPKLAESLGESLEKSTATTVILHGLLGPDIRHFEHIVMRPGLHHGLIRRETHGVGFVLKARGRLAPFITSTFAGDISDAKQQLAEFDIFWRDQNPSNEFDHIRQLRKADSEERAQIKEIRQKRRALRTNV